MKIKKSDVEKYGGTVGCEGCTAANRGGSAKNHNEECRKRFEVLLEDDEEGRKRLRKYGERLVEATEVEVERSVKSRRVAVEVEAEMETQDHRLTASLTDRCGTTVSDGRTIQLDFPPREESVGR